MEKKLIWDLVLIIGKLLFSIIKVLRACTSPPPTFGCLTLCSTTSNYYLVRKLDKLLIFQRGWQLRGNSGHQGDPAL